MDYIQITRGLSGYNKHNVLTAFKLNNDKMVKMEILFHHSD